MLSNHVSFKPGPFLKHGMGSSFLENKQILGHPARPNGHPPDGPRLLGAGLARPLVTFQNSSSPVANSSRTAVLCCLPLSQHPGYTCEGLSNTGHLQYPPNSTRAGRVRPLTTQLPGSRSTRQCCKGLQAPVLCLISNLPGLLPQSQGETNHPSAHPCSWPMPRASVPEPSPQVGHAYPWSRFSVAGDPRGHLLGWQRVEATEPPVAPAGQGWAWAPVRA